MTGPERPHRGTIFVEDATILAIDAWPGQQFILRLDSPRCAAHATAGSFIHAQCADSIPMRRPLSIMRAHADEGWVEVLFKIVGEGLDALAHRSVGSVLSSMGPIGRGFTPSPERPRTLLIGGGVGIPPMVFLSEVLMQSEYDWRPQVLMGSEIPFPFDLVESGLDVPGLPDDVDQSLALLEGWGVPARLASLADIPGTWRGYVTDAADAVLQTMSAEERAQTEIFACGPTPMLEAVAALAARHNLPAQVSLEEYMACAVGGCAGCAVLVQTEEGPAMQRVCVDGPVFEAARVFPQSI